ncbi:GNAT family N-acetyltransferase [Actinomadura rubrisoli]|uniref:GNAT family N-acetyltransferase n=1 Tax=Actinomadura rubrisoli TaxID=2530368 RepID=A0A4R5C929_9ACTN|nr:GNAT family N-acetyltransferase [Actinomadura rubrisoli]TDD95299.1 GNAT family N-acetyltransferase [Actinomadura rubrisoli]
MRSIGPAAPDDLAEVLALLNGVASWLTSRGVNQWAAGFSVERIAPIIERGELYLVRENGSAIATVTVSTHGDADFWTAEELAEPARYVAKLATAREYAGQGLGELLLRWTIDLGARQGAQWIRLDAWRTNQRLHDFYRDAGWTHLRTAELEHRRSGALFQHPAVADPQARCALPETLP